MSRPRCGTSLRVLSRFSSVVRMRSEVARRSDVEILGRLTLSVEGAIGVGSSLTFRFDDRHVAPPREHRFEAVRAHLNRARESLACPLLSSGPLALANRAA
jgi:hypothetical protein